MILICSKKACIAIYSSFSGLWYQLYTIHYTLQYLYASIDWPGQQSLKMTRRHWSSNKRRLKKIPLKCLTELFCLKEGERSLFFTFDCKCGCPVAVQCPTLYFPLCHIADRTLFKIYCTPSGDTTPVCTPTQWWRTENALYTAVHNAQCTGERRGRPTRSRTNEQRALITWCTTHHSHHSHHSLSWLMC